MKFLLSLLFIFICIIHADLSQQINMRDIQVLTFQKGMYTTAKRTSPIPQLKRVGGQVRESYEPSTVQCKNAGWNGASVQWKCQADMDEKYRFGSIEVVCEGFDHPGDQYVLLGSCGLEYTLEYTAKGQTKKNRYNRHQGNYRNPPVYVEKSSGFGGFIFFFVLFVVLIGICVYCSSNKPASSGAPGPSSFQPIYPTTTYINTDSGYSNGFLSGYTVGSLNNRSYDSGYSNSYTTNSSYDDPDEDDSTTRTATGYGGSRTR